MMKARTGSRAFWKRLEAEIEGDVEAGDFARGRYATDASIYQCFPAGVACPKSEADVEIIVEMAREEGLPIVPRGGGTSTAGQALGEGIVVDFSKYLTKIGPINKDTLSCSVEPGASPAVLNRALLRHGLIFPLTIASARQATLGGMLGNNSSGLRTLRYGRMADNLISVRAVLTDGQRVEFEEVREGAKMGPEGPGARLLDLLEFGERHEAEIRRAFPSGALREGYSFDILLPSEEPQNLAALLAGSEGTLALATLLNLKLAPKPEHRALGVCRFETLTAAMRAVRSIVALDPSAVEFLDRPLVEIIESEAGSDAQAQRLVQNDPGALLIVEFDQQNPVENTRKLKDLRDAGSNLGIVEVLGSKAQDSLWSLRRRALSRALNPKLAAQPVAFLEDGIVPLAELADFSAKLEATLAKQGVRALIFGHAGQGCLHVRPVLNLTRDSDRLRMRALSEAIGELILEHKGALTSGHGLGLARGEAFESFRGKETASLTRQLKALLDPHNLLNPGKIASAPRFDEPSLLRASHLAFDVSAPVRLQWEAAAAPERALDHAARCVGLSLCRTGELRFACPSFAVSRDERDSPRGRANSMRLALSGQLGRNALGSPAMQETMMTCVSCKACKLTCPKAIDIPKMKVEALAAAQATGSAPEAYALFAHFPAHIDRARRWRWILKLRDLVPAFARMSERRLGWHRDRPWPKFAGRPFRALKSAKPGKLGLVALFADSFNRAFEPANLRAASRILHAGGFGVTAFASEESDAPLCCGRTLYEAGFIEEARGQALRFASAAASFRQKGILVIGLEPACVLMARDEFASLGVNLEREAAPLLFEEFLTAEIAAGRFSIPLKPIEGDVLVKSHCHELAAGIETAAISALGHIPGLNVSAAPPSCCGFNGLMGASSETFETSLAMAELALFPAIRKAGIDALISATGFTCRRQIHDGLGRIARHPAMILDLAMQGEAEIYG